MTGIVPLSAGAASELEEIVVTATKRTQDLQDVALAVTALSGEKLDQLNVANFDDYIRYLPGVNSAGRGRGQSSIFIRGMTTDSSDQTSIEIGAPVPNVALYLDEQPVSSGGRNLDLYAADIERLEVLPGPCPPRGASWRSCIGARTCRQPRKWPRRSTTAWRNFPRN